VLGLPSTVRLVWAGRHGPVSPAHTCVNRHRETTLVQAGCVSKYQYKTSPINHTNWHTQNNKYTHRDAHWTYQWPQRRGVKSPPYTQTVDSRHLKLTILDSNYPKMSTLHTRLQKATTQTVSDRWSHYREELTAICAEYVAEYWPSIG